MSSDAKKRLSRREFLHAAGLVAGVAALGGCAPSAPQVVEKVVTKEVEKVVEKSVEKVVTATPTTLEYKGDIILWEWPEEARDIWLKARIAAWEDVNPGIRVKIEAKPWGEMETKMFTAVQAGTGPDIAYMHNFWRFDYQRAGLLVPYDDYPEYFPAEYLDGLVSTPFFRSDDGHIYAQTYGSAGNLLIWNEQLFADAGLSEKDLPKTWDEYVKLAKELTKYDDDGNIVQAGIHQLTNFWLAERLWKNLVYQVGGHQFTEDVNKCLWDSDESIQALQLLYDMLHTHKLTSVEFESGQQPYEAGKAATTFNYGFFRKNIGKRSPEVAEVTRYDVQPTWAGKPEPIWGFIYMEEAWSVFKKGNEAKERAAMSFLSSCLVGESVRRNLAELWGLVPDYISLVNDPEVHASNPAIPPAAEMISHCLYFSERIAASEKFLREMFDKIFIQKVSPAQAAAEATTQMNEFLAGDTERRYVTEYMPPPKIL